MACCRAALSAATVADAALAADELVIVDMKMLRASVVMRKGRNRNAGWKASLPSKR
jgi:hypothetical protein